MHRFFFSALHFAAIFALKAAVCALCIDFSSALHVHATFALKAAAVCARQAPEQIVIGSFLLLWLLMEPVALVRSRGCPRDDCSSIDLLWPSSSFVHILLFASFLCQRFARMCFCICDQHLACISSGCILAVWSTVVHARIVWLLCIARDERRCAER